MKKFIEFLSETQNIDFIKKMKDWLSTLNLTKRVPGNLKKQMEILKYIENKIRLFGTNSSYIDALNSEIKSLFYLNFPDEIISLIDKSFTKDENQPFEIEKNGVTYIKRDASAYKKFLDAIEEIDSFLETLKGFHRKPLKNLKIAFVKKTDLRGKASYKQDKDELWINLFSMGKEPESYGSLVYVILHELAHRYLQKVNKQSWNIDSSEWSTTKYSKTDSMTGEEKFAELFAMSHWKSKYSEHEIKINNFLKVIE